MNPMNPDDSKLRNDAVIDWMNDMAPLGIFTTDDKLVIQTWNRWLEMNSGLTADRVIGHPLFELWPELAACCRRD